MNLTADKSRRTWRRDVVVFGLVFGVVLAGAGIHMLRLPAVYRSTGKLEWHAGSGTRHRSVDREQRFRDEMKDMTEVTGSSIAIAVAERLTPEEQEAFLRPFGGTLADETEGRVVENRIQADHRIHLDAEASAVRIEYLHPDPAMAARVAGLMMGEFRGRLMRRRIDRELASLEALKLRTEKQERRVNEAATALQGLRQKRILEGADAYESDASYMALRKHLSEEEAVLVLLVTEMRDTTMGTFVEEVGWVSGSWPKPADVAEPLRVRMLFWEAPWRKGVMLAIVCGLLAVVGVRQGMCWGWAVSDR